ncbi:MAG: hypothetical protein HOP99_03600 [Dermatophilaceae bacterium]|nr:hypothetical protein [Dermatophilaceae bacterium]NUR17399.1 hypothetical protein [Dermatophilaceae bacterium]
MKTPAAALARPSTSTGTRLRRLAVVGLVAPVVALAACSGESPVTADPTAPAGATSSTTSPSEASTSPTPTDTTTTSESAAPVDKMTTKTLTATLKDPELGHTITARRLVRNLSWPSGQPVGAKQFEIVGVWVTLKAGSRYSASVDPSMLSLVAASPAQTVVPTSEFTKRWGATVLKPAKRSQSTGGWVFFKVDRGTTSSLKLAFNRPAYQVSTTDRKLPAKTFTVVLTK